MVRTISFSCRRLAASLAALSCLLPAGPLAAGPQRSRERPAASAPAPVEAEKDLDVRSGEKALRLIMETDDINPVRKRAMEIGPEELRKERSRIESLKKSGRFSLAASASAWTSLGPTYRPVPGGTAQNAGDDSGLAADVKVHPTDPKTIYVGTAGGGVWKTTDGGQSWIPLTDDLGQLPIGAVAIAASRPQRVYAAIGCGDSSSYYGQTQGLGVIISDDSGSTWRVSRAGGSTGAVFFELDVDPRNPDSVLAASNTGLWRSTDGGESFTRVVSVQAQSISRCRTAPGVVFAGTSALGKDSAGKPVVVKPGSVWRSGDGGATWVEKAVGLPGDVTTRARAEVAVAPTDPDRVYALFSDKDDATLDVAVSDDGGSTWTAMGIASQAPILGSQGTTFVDMAVDPSSRDTVYAGGLDQWKSTDGGKTWKQLTRWDTLHAPLPYLHADQHAIAFGPDGAVYFATDGGLARTTNGGQSFTSLNRGLVTMQFYYLCQSQNDPNLVLGGHQDNGTSMRVSGTEWRRVVGGDGFGCLVHPSDPKMLHASVYEEQVQLSTNGGLSWSDATSGLTDAGGESANFITILHRNPARPDTVYTISKKKLWVSANNATLWKTNSTSPPAGLNNFRDFHVLSTDGSRILLAADAGQLFETLDEGATFAKLGTVPVNTLASVRYDRRSVRTIWAASATTTSGLERVWRSENGGQTWTQVSGIGTAAGLPDVPVFVVEQDPWDPNAWWAGTFVGLYRSPDNGRTWGRHGSGLPNVIVTDLGFYLPDKKVRAATFGRGMWEASALTGPSVPAEIRFPSVDSSVVAGLAVSLLGGTVGADPSGFAFTWDFADGSAPGAGVHVLHAFNSTGTRKVALTASGSGGSSQASRTLTVVPNGGGFGPGGQADLSARRVGVTVSFRNVYTNVVAPATPLVQADELAFFYFTDPLNPEVFVKVLDFGAASPYLCFYGGLTNYEYTVTFTVLESGKSISFVTPADSYKGGIDNTSLPHATLAGLLARDGSSFQPLPAGAAGAAGVVGTAVVPRPGAAPAPAADAQELLLQGGKVGVKVAWKNQYDGSSGNATAIPKQDAYGYFYFSTPTNAEVFVKVLDFGAASPYLLFWAGLTDFQYTLTFRNTATGKSWSYTKPPGTYDGGANTTDLGR